MGKPAAVLRGSRYRGNALASLCKEPPDPGLLLPVGRALRPPSDRISELRRRRRSTHELYERLFDEVFDHGSVEGFDRDVFASVEREAKIRNYDASHLDKMPDLLVRFVDRPAGAMNTQYGLFIECKPVDVTHTVGACYCDKGLIRFVRGDYAWTMRNAMMIGYARPGYELVPELADALAKQRKEPIPTEAGPTPCARSLVSSLVQQVTTTVHERTFLYMDSLSSPGQISVRHLWLKRPSV